MWVSPIVVTLGQEGLASLKQMDSEHQLLVVSLLASLEADDQLEGLVAASPGDVGEFLTCLAEDPLELVGRAGISPPSIPRTVLTRAILQDAGMLYWYERRMSDVLMSASEELHIVLPLYPQYQVPTGIHGFTGFVFILDEMPAPHVVTPADALLYFATIDEEKAAPSAFTLGKANTDAAGALLLVENRYQWSYGRGMWIEPAD
jgi:hypothetical protein